MKEEKYYLIIVILCIIIIILGCSILFRPTRTVYKDRNSSKTERPDTIPTLVYKEDIPRKGRIFHQDPRCAKSIDEAVNFKDAAESYVDVCPKCFSEKALKEFLEIRRNYRDSADSHY